MFSDFKDRQAEIENASYVLGQVDGNLETALAFRNDPEAFETELNKQLIKDLIALSDPENEIIDPIQPGRRILNHLRCGSSKELLELADSIKKNDTLGDAILLQLPIASEQTRTRIVQFISRALETKQ